MLLTPRKLPTCKSFASPLVSQFNQSPSRFTVYKDADLFDFINAPIGKGLPVKQTLRPLIAIPTTAGTGSETTGAAIVDITSRSFKTGIANRALKPVLGIVVSSWHSPWRNPGILIGLRYRTPKTQSRVPQSCTLVLVSTCFSTVWKATLPFRSSLQASRQNVTH